MRKQKEVKEQRAVQAKAGAAGRWGSLQLGQGAEGHSSTPRRSSRGCPGSIRGDAPSTASCLLDDCVYRLRHFHALAAHRQLHGHVSLRVDAKGQPHERLQPGGGKVGDGTA